MGRLSGTEQEWLAGRTAGKAAMERYVTTSENPHPYAGMSILEILWQDLDDVMDQLMEQDAPDKQVMGSEFSDKNGRHEGHQLADEWYGVLKEWGELRGQAQGVAFAIAILTNPYAADVPAVKKEAMARWEDRNK